MAQGFEKVGVFDGINRINRMKIFNLRVNKYPVNPVNPVQEFDAMDLT